MKDFFRDLESMIQEAVKKEVIQILKQTGEEKVYGVALVTDSDCITLYLVANTYEYMRKKDEEEIKRYQQYMKQYPNLYRHELSEESIKMVREGTRYITKWDCQEWGYSIGKEGDFVKVSEVLFKKAEERWADKEKAEAEEEEYQNEFFKTVISAFKKVIDGKVFGENTGEITYFVSISDDERTPEIENESARLLNSESIYKEFLEKVEVFE